MRRVGVVTTSRADYGIYLSVLRRLQAHPEVDLVLYVSGTHLSRMHGLTIERIREDGFTAIEPIDVLLAGDSPGCASKAMGLGMIGFAQAYERTRPDLVVVLGDRFEMFAAAAAAVPFNLPLAHIHGGETTQGAIDDVFRHAISKMSHLHFVSTAHYGRTLEAMGEEAWRVEVVGAPALDLLSEIELASREELAEVLRLPALLTQAPLLVTFHPETRATPHLEAQIDEVVTALAQWDEGPILITGVNADPGNARIREAWQGFERARPERVRVIESLGARRYFGLASIAAAMVGNSSSGIIEAASFGLPVIDIGERQRGRVAGENVRHVRAEAARIVEALNEVTTKAWRQRMKGVDNPYDQGGAASRIVTRLVEEPLNERLLLKAAPLEFEAQQLKQSEREQEKSE